MRQHAVTRFATIAAAMALIILYGSFYPFAFYHRGPLGDALAELWGSWPVPPSSRGDLIANLLLYTPLGFFGVLALPEGGARPRRIAIMTAIGCALSVAVELGQFYDRGRGTNLSDVYLNTLGSGLGAAAGILVGREFRLPLPGAVERQPFPLLLVVAFLGFRLYPYLPTLDPRKIIAGVQPLIHPAMPSGLALLREGVVWLVLGGLVSALVGQRRSAPLLAWLLLVTLLLETVIVDRFVTTAEILGGGAAILLWAAVVSRVAAIRRHLPPLLLALLVAVEALYPFQFRAAARPFGWIPFLSFIRGAPEIAVQAFCLKVFLYGALLWLLVRAGLRLAHATVATAAFVFVLRFSQIYLAGRSAEITDAVMVLVLAAALKLMSSEGGAPGTA